MRQSASRFERELGTAPGDASSLAAEPDGLRFFQQAVAAVS